MRLIPKPGQTGEPLSEFQLAIDDVEARRDGGTHCHQIIKLWLFIAIHKDM
jgi:hypothetical protein